MVRSDYAFYIHFSDPYTEKKAALRFCTIEVTKYLKFKDTDST